MSAMDFLLGDIPPGLAFIQMINTGFLMAIWWNIHKLVLLLRSEFTAIRSYSDAKFAEERHHHDVSHGQIAKDLAVAIAKMNGRH